MELSTRGSRMRIFLVWEKVAVFSLLDSLLAWLFDVEVFILRLCIVGI